MNPQILHIDTATELAQYKDINPFIVPSRYFEKSGHDFLSAAIAANAETDHLLGDPCRDLPFACPDGYFDSSHHSFMKEIVASDLIINASERAWPNQLPFEVPIGFFEDFSSQILARINASDEDLVDDSYLKQLDKGEVLAIPEAYFESANFARIAIGEQTDNADPCLAKPIHRRFRFNNYAAAATVALIFGLGAFMMLGNKDAQQLTFDQQLAMIPKSQISNYIERNIDDFDLNLLEAKASKNSVQTTKSMLLDVDKADIEAYLQSEGI